MAKVDQIIVYPIQFCSGIPLSPAVVHKNRLQFDQQYVFTSFDGRLIIPHKWEKLSMLSIKLISNNLSITTPNGQFITVTPQDFSLQLKNNNVQNKTILADIASIKVNRWFSCYLDEDIQLRRQINRSPLLLMNNISLYSAIKEYKQPLTIRQFRANITIDDASAFVENTWTIIKIGNVTFKLIKSCGSHTVNLGMNMIAMNSGIIRFGDQIEIIKTKSAKKRDTRWMTNMTKQNTNRYGQSIKIQYQMIELQGNNEQTILEQLEQNKISLPYSCRSGICGCCQIELIDGEVIPLTADAIKENNKILACSCKPKGNIKIR